MTTNCIIGWLHMSIGHDDCERGQTMTAVTLSSLQRKNDIHLTHGQHNALLR